MRANFEGTRPRRLLLCLDGVPHEIVAAVKGRGLFDGFGEPAQMLSPFPTMTNVALSTMLGASAPLGYESLYFDRTAGSLRGGVSKYIGRRTPDKIPSSYVDELDYQEPLHCEFLVYVAPEKVLQADFNRFHQSFLAAPPTKDFFAFLKATDGLLHIRGRHRLEVALEVLDQILRDIRVRDGDGTEIVLFSDHGMNLVENRRVHLQTHLRRAGYQMAERLERNARRRIAVPAFGLCGYVALYCADEEAAASVAHALTGLEGVDFAVHADGESAVMVKGEGGVARIHRTQSEPSAGNRLAISYRYEQVTGDPLHLAAVLGKLSVEGLLDQCGCASDEAWYKHTADHIYPDVLANLYDALHAPRVRHTADVLVSLHDGYYYGSSVFSRMARLVATHGNALRPSTTAFLMSTHRKFPPYVRAGAAEPFLRG
ncbi:MAG: alkaline phosphatase family protein [Pyrinomonadaceae bacterium]|nr:alkaline phosphatase family protein [Pyrinomonadaceae bacterium]